ncbi:helix-turn-helix domain-containing protein [Enterovirga aerilata]|uniref:Helix-turn-helix transcriptional regulator n=1 Tax=Enterovirga aerilata TaxID=2730920 RepID=A0A849HXN7_9HYPH|nr:helix-turn-helix transcriptional regulator [Enterovirga sp. DB1703]NNM71872.1 helix-turn-helix transcriptional regulator [Enterovirga sp. DB1703]
MPTHTRFYGIGLRDLRLALGCSQLEFSELTGIPRASISRIENGQACTPSRASRLFDAIWKLDGLRHVQFNSIFGTDPPELDFPKPDIKFLLLNEKVYVDQGGTQPTDPDLTAKLKKTQIELASAIGETAETLNASTSFKSAIRLYIQSVSGSTDIFLLDSIYLALRTYLRSERDALDEINIVLLGRLFHNHVRLREQFPDYVLYNESLRTTEISKNLTNDELADIRATLEEGARKDIFDPSVSLEINKTTSTETQSPEIEHRNDYDIRSRVLALYKFMKETDPSKVMSKLQGWKDLSDKLQDTINKILSTMHW